MTDTDVRWIWLKSRNAAVLDQAFEMEKGRLYMKSPEGRVLAKIHDGPAGRRYLQFRVGPRFYRSYVDSARIYLATKGWDEAPGRKDGKTLNDGLHNLISNPERRAAGRGTEQEVGAFRNSAATSVDSAWRAVIRIYGEDGKPRQKHLGLWATKEEAQAAFEAVRDFLKDGQQGRKATVRSSGLTRLNAGARPGVRFDKRRSRWEVRTTKLETGRPPVYLGSYDTKREANERYSSWLRENGLG